MMQRRDAAPGRIGRARRALAILAVGALMAGACGDDGSDGGTGEATAGAPERIVSISPTGTEMLFAIGAGDQVVAVDEFSTWPPEAPVSGLSGFEPNVEAIAELEPDLVVLDFDPGDVVSGLDALGIETSLLWTAASLDDTYAQIEQLGTDTGHADGAAELVERIRSEIDELTDAAPDGASLTYYHEVSTDYFTSTSSTFIGEVYGLFGLENIADAADPDGASFGFPQLSDEYIIDADPDIIFLADTNFEAQSLETLRARPGWDTITAVSAGNVVELDDDVASRWGPRVVELAAAISGVLESMAVPS